MTTATKPLTLQEYADLDDGTDTRYELIDGCLSPVSTESDINDRIASFLYAYFLQLGIPYYRLSMKAQVAVSGRLANARQPDLMLLSEESATALHGAKQRLIMHDMPPPSLVVEVVSPKQAERDYRYKRLEYAGRHIPEYWIVDPIAGQVKVLTWDTGLYTEKAYRGDQTVGSPLFPALTLTAEHILLQKQMS